MEVVPDEAIVTDAAAVRAGAGQAGRADFDLIYREHHEDILGVAMRVTRNRADAEDAVQAAFMAFAVGREKGEEILLPRHWLRRVTKRMALNVVRSRTRRTKGENRFAEATSDQTEVSADAAMQNAELRRVLGEELKSLPTKYRVAVMMASAEGADLTEVGRELKIPASTLRVRLMRARRMLTERLRARGVVVAWGAVTALVIEHVAEWLSDFSRPLLKAHRWKVAGSMVLAVSCLHGATQIGVEPVIEKVRHMQSLPTIDWNSLIKGILRSALPSPVARADESQAHDVTYAVASGSHKIVSELAPSTTIIIHNDTRAVAENFSNVRLTPPQMIHAPVLVFTEPLPALHSNVALPARASSIHERPAVAKVNVTGDSYKISASPDLAETNTATPIEIAFGGTASGSSMRSTEIKPGPGDEVVPLDANASAMAGPAMPDGPLAMFPSPGEAIDSEGWLAMAPDDLDLADADFRLVFTTGMPIDVSGSEITSIDDFDPKTAMLPAGGFDLAATDILEDPDAIFSTAVARGGASLTAPGVASVPEPLGVSVLAIGASWLLMRRQRRVKSI